jgi:hypothetical protein
MKETKPTKERKRDETHLQAMTKGKKKNGKTKEMKYRRAGI